MLASLLCTFNMIWLIMNDWSKWSISIDLDFFRKKKKIKKIFIINRWKNTFFLFVNKFLKSYLLSIIFFFKKEDDLYLRENDEDQGSRNVLLYASIKL